METIAQEIVQEIVNKIKQYDNLHSVKAEDTVNGADKLGEVLAQRPGEDKENQLTKTQIRKFLDAVIRIKNLHKDNVDYRAQAMLIKPKLAYIVGKTKKSKRIKGETIIINPVGPLMEVLEPCINRIYNKEDFERFADFVEAIVAYHKYYGGKD